MSAIPSVRRLVAASSLAIAGAGRNVLTLLGGNADVGPERATTWSLGAEFRPEALPGLFASLNYFDIDYKDVIDTPGNNAAVFSDPALARYAIINPSLQQISDLVVARINSGFYRPVTAFNLFTPAGASNVYAIVDGRKRNTGRVVMKGLDFQLQYQLGTGIGDWTLGMTGTRVFTYKFQAVPGAALVGLVPNTQLNPAPVAPTVQDEAVGSMFTVDATGTYTFPQESRLLRDLSLSVSAQNLFDRDPPFARVSNSQVFDSANASALGRMVSFELRKKF